MVCTIGATVLTLFDAALGGHEFQSFQGHKYQDVGIVAMSLYVVFAVIILMNLIIARMSSAHEGWYHVISRVYHASIWRIYICDIYPVIHLCHTLCHHQQHH